MDGNEQHPAVSRTLETQLQQVHTELATVDQSLFSPQAFSALQDRINRYISQLVDESNNVAKRHRADTISEAHVETASNYLVADTGRRLFRHLGTVGGILLGAGLSNLFSIVTTKSYTSIGVGVTTGVCVVGAFLVALHMARD